ncbi:sodium:solute symporter [Aquimarina sp. TRL1]|uniref:sodium:solute symporter n=1 Tax=Aquimarina sp. (strain TRL1) TaxID=2736252 RepID=UPI0015890ABC|nr:sodium:solute symporter [Aquimarina sp. TRL1]QKX05674.1 sodium:solute symporter [Aquimarina sp. TRL1]
MQPTHIIILIASYFIVLLIISHFTGKNSENDTFFNANKQSPWYIVAFGMIGASLSGVTFISVPGWVEASQFSYMQMVLGYTLGYLVIGTVLLPLYYRLNLTSIYTYLETRFGLYAYKTGASFFLISRVIGASFRLFLVANVLQTIIFDSLHIPFWVTVIITILLIWLYTFKSGIKTIVWTDTLQTLFMLIALGVAIYYVSQDLGINGTNILAYVMDDPNSKIFFFEDIKDSKYFWKQFLSGAFIAIVMTGLDQDMMQKNLTCRSLKDAQKNMFWFTIVLTFVNFVFLALGLLLTQYASQNGIEAQRDKLFPYIATQSDLGIGIAIFFVLGLIAAAYSSADSALTSLTTSFSIDIIDIKKRIAPDRQVNVRKLIHILFSILLILVIIIFKYAIADESVIAKLFKFAGFTYGPLLGLYAFGLFTTLKVSDRQVPFICIFSVLLSIIINFSFQIFVYLSTKSTWNEAAEVASSTYYQFGFEILIINGAITFIGLLASSVLILIRRK